MPNDDRALVTLAEMASKLRLQPQDLRREVEQGRLPAVRVGEKGLLFDAASVLRILRDRAREAFDPGGSDGNA